MTLLEPAVLEIYERDLMARLVAMFSEDAPHLVRSILAARDPKERTRSAHALRGCALNLGATKLAASCAAIEAAPGDPALVSELDALVASTMEALRAHCSAMQCAPL